MTQRKSFGSDNHAGVHPAVLRAIVDANSGDAVAYGADERTEHATASLDCSLAELAECADVLSFGGTKNGAMGAEALIVMSPGLAADVPYLRKQQTQLTSKMRFVAAQFGALLQDDLWRANAAHANAM